MHESSRTSVPGRTAFALRVRPLRARSPSNRTSRGHCSSGLGSNATSATRTKRSTWFDEHSTRNRTRCGRRLFLARLELDRGQMDAAREAYGAALESARLRTRLDLNDYERELLGAPAWQFRELAEALR